MLSSCFPLEGYFPSARRRVAAASAPLTTTVQSFPDVREKLLDIQLGFKSRPYKFYISYIISIINSKLNYIDLTAYIQAHIIR